MVLYLRSNDMFYFDDMMLQKYTNHFMAKLFVDEFVFLMRYFLKYKGIFKMKIPSKMPIEFKILIVLNI